MKIPRKIPLIPKYLVLNSQALIFTSWIVAIFISILVLLGLHKSLLTEITDILLILAGLLFVFFFVALYMGMILEPEEPHVLNNVKENMEKGGVPDLSGLMKNMYIDGVVIIILVGMLVYGLFFGFYFFIVFLMILYLVFYLAYGMVFRHSQDTKGDVIKSLTHSVMYTILYTGVFFILIQVVKVFQAVT